MSEDTPQQRIQSALDIASSYGGIDGAHHKMWVIDQMIRALTGCPLVTEDAKDVVGISYSYKRQGESASYKRWVAEYEGGEDGDIEWEWDTGIAP